MPPRRPAGSAFRAASARAALAGLLLAAGALAPAGPLAAQERGAAEILEARRLQEAGEHAAAAERLRRFLDEHPEEPSALRLLASALESAGDLRGAGEAYRAALRIRPHDPLLRLDYGRLLVDAGELERARRTLEPLAADPGAPSPLRADALVELARVALGEGRAEAAEAHLRQALAAREDHAGALARLRALHRPRSPWLRAAGGVQDDDQPVDRREAGIRGGLRLFPWLAAELGAEVRRLTSGPANETLTAAGASLRARWDLLNVEGRVRGGGFRRTGTGTGDWTAAAAVTVRGPVETLLRVEGAREPYLRTAASLEEETTALSIGGVLGRPDAAGWAGALAYREERVGEFRIEDVSAWFLAPAVRQPVGTLRLGYRFHGADSNQSAFVSLLPRELDPRGRVPGRYAPAYTPRELRSHVVLAEVRHDREAAGSLRLEGSWGFRAEEESPLLVPALPGDPGAGTDLQFRRRSFVPWHVTGAVTIPVTPRLVLDVRGGHRRTAFRDRSFLETTWTFYDLPAELR